MNFVSRHTIEAICPEAYTIIPPRIRDRIPAEVHTVPEHALVFRRGFSFTQRFVDEVFARLGYRDGERWPMWKLVAAFYFVEARVGHRTLKQVGEQIYPTMPWVDKVTTLSDALRLVDDSYRAHHGGAPRERIGGWTISAPAPGKVVMTSDTPYPCSFEEGVVAGICYAFPKLMPTYQVVEPPLARRHGGIATAYEVRHG